MNSRQRWKIKRAQKHAAANAGQGSDADLERVVSACLMGVSGNVAKALTLIDGPAAPRQPQEDCGAMYLPQVAMLNAGHRKTRKDAVHIIK